MWVLTTNETHDIITMLRIETLYDEVDMYVTRWSYPLTEVTLMKKIDGWWLLYLLQDTAPPTLYWRCYFKVANVQNVVQRYIYIKKTHFPLNCCSWMIKSCTRAHIAASQCGCKCAHMYLPAAFPIKTNISGCCECCAASGDEQCVLTVAADWKWKRTHRVSHQGQ